MIRRTHRQLAVVAALLTATLVGCGKEGPDMGQVTGKVTRAASPVVGVTVYFQPEEGRISQGVTNELGDYKLRYTRTEDGAKVGKHKVFVAFVPPAGPEAEMARAAGKLKPHPDEKAILEKYGSFATSTIDKVVEPGSQVIDLALD